MSLSMFVSIMPWYGDLNGIEKFLIILIMFLFGPCLMIAGMVEILLDTFLPSGWNDDDEGDDNDKKL